MSVKLMKWSIQRAYGRYDKCTIISHGKTITPYISVKTAKKIIDEHNRQIEYLLCFTQESALNVQGGE